MLLSGEYGNLGHPDVWKNSKLGNYLLYGTWEAQNGLRILAGYKYEDEPTHPAELRTQELYDIEWSAEIRLKYLNEFWVRDLRDQNEISAPKVFIDWALTKNIRPTWLDWAINKGLYTPKQEVPADITPTNKGNPYVFDKTSKTYPPELDYALQAWQATSATEENTKPKTRIKAWLDANTKLSAEAKERISIVANWNKMGGATRSD